MPLSMPDYIKKAGVVDAPIAHDWDDSDPELAYVTMDDRLQHRIREISHRGVLALSNGFVEWVFWRLHKDAGDPMLLQKIESTWAAIIDWRYLSDQEIPDRKNWQGPIRGPMWAAAEMLDRIINFAKKGVFGSHESVCLSYLDLHVLPEQKHYKDWRRAIIQRLAKLHPLDRNDRVGRPVPREALDPDFDYKPELDKELLSKFLRGLDPATNPYLSSPEEMLKAGFEGTPYIL